MPSVTTPRRLSEAQVRAIERLLAEGLPRSVIARRVQVRYWAVVVVAGGRHYWQQDEAERARRPGRRNWSSSSRATSFASGSATARRSPGATT